MGVGRAVEKFKSNGRQTMEVAPSNTNTKSSPDLTLHNDPDPTPSKIRLKGRTDEWAYLWPLSGMK
jgi:hypothetical protein